MIPAGVRGLQGIQGIQGEIGPQGPVGPQGPIGPVGPPNSLSIGTVTKGEEAEATITGQAPNQMLNLVLPQGDIPDMHEYVKFTDTAGIDYETGINKNGSMVGGTYLGLKIDEGKISGVNYSYDTYSASSGALVVSKATLENVIIGKALQNASQVSSAVGTETENRVNADNYLQGQIDAVTSSSDVVDIVNSYQDLLNYQEQVTEDDIIKVLSDERHDNAHSYWRATDSGIARGESLTIDADGLTKVNLNKLEGCTTVVGSPSLSTPSTISSFTDTTITLDMYPHVTGITNVVNYEIDLGGVELRHLKSLAGQDYYDEIYQGANNKWYIRKQIEKIVLNGSETWTKSYGSGSKYCLYTALPNAKNNSTLAYSTLLCDRFIGDVKTTDSMLSEVGTMVQNGTNAYFTYTTDVSDFKTWLGSNNVTLYYILADPVNTEITDSTLLSKLNSLRNKTLSNRNRIILTQTTQANTVVLNVDVGVSKWLYIGKEGPYYTKSEADIELNSKEDKTNKVTSLSSSSTDLQYPSAKCVYDIVGDINEAIDIINGEVI